MATVPYTQYTFAGQTGNVALNQLDSNFSNIGNLVNNALVVTRPSQPNITSVGTLNTLNVTGDITSGGFVRGNGALLTGVVASNANALNLVGNTLSSSVVYSNLTTVGTLGGLNVNGSISANGYVTAGYFYGDGSHITNLPITIGATGPAGAAGATGPAGASGSPGATGSAGAVGATGPSAGFSGNLTANLNGQGYSISNVATISTTGNIVSSGYLIGTVANATYATSAGVVTTNAQPNITSVGTLSSLGVSGNILTNGLISALGNVTGGYIVGNGSRLNSLAGANVTGTVANATYAVSAGTTANATFATSAGTVTASAQSNITSVGTLASLVVGGNISTGSAISATGNIVGAGLYVGASPVMTSNIARYTWVMSNIPTPGIGNIGDIWYQIF
jgi:hypothetical protein